MERTAKVYLVGAGPGDPDLLTRKALRLLNEADVVIYDRLVSAEVLACASPDAVCIYAGKAQGKQEAIQAEIFEHILQYADHGAQTIVRLKSGDPCIFGRASEEAEFLLMHGIPVEIVPGISSAIAGPTLAGIPVTYRGVAGSFAVIAGHRQSLTYSNWSAYDSIDTLIVLMGVEHRDVIAQALIDCGRPASQPVAFIEYASTDRQRVVESTLRDVANRRTSVCAPAIFVIGEVVRLRQRSTCLEAAGICL